MPIQVPTDLWSQLQRGVEAAPGMAGQEGSTTSGTPIPGPNDPLHHLAVVLGLMSGQDQYTQTADQQTTDQAAKEKEAATPIADASSAQVSSEDLRARTSMSQGQMLQSQPMPTPGANGDAAINAGKKYLGVKYVYGANDPAVGLDCSSFVQRTFADIGISLPRVTYDQVKVGQAIDNPNQLQPGDLVFFTGDKQHVANGHVGIYVGNGVMIDAPHTGAQVRYDQINYGNITAMRRVIP